MRSPSTPLHTDHLYLSLTTYPLCSSAAIFETIRKGIVGKISAASAVTKGVFNLAYALKKHLPAFSGPADAIVFSKIKDVTGGRLRIAMSGGGGLSKPTQEFLNTTLATILQGYGLTETCGMGRFPSSYAFLSLC